MLMPTYYKIYIEVWCVEATKAVVWVLSLGCIFQWDCILDRKEKNMNIVYYTFGFY